VIPLYVCRIHTLTHIHTRTNTDVCYMRKRANENEKERERISSRTLIEMTIICIFGLTHCMSQDSYDLGRGSYLYIYMDVYIYT